MTFITSIIACLALLLDVTGAMQTTVTISTMVCSSSYGSTKISPVPRTTSVNITHSHVTAYYTSFRVVTSTPPPSTSTVYTTSTFTSTLPTVTDTSTAVSTQFTTTSTTTTSVQYATTTSTITVVSTTTLVVPPSSSALPDILIAKPTAAAAPRAGVTKSIYPTQVNCMEMRTIVTTTPVTSVVLTTTTAATPVVTTTSTVVVTSYVIPAHATTTLQSATTSTTLQTITTTSTSYTPTVFATTTSTTTISVTGYCAQPTQFLLQVSGSAPEDGLFAVASSDGDNTEQYIDSFTQPASATCFSLVGTQLVVVASGNIANINAGRPVFAFYFDDAGTISAGGFAIAVCSIDPSTGLLSCNDSGDTEFSVNDDLLFIGTPAGTASYGYSPVELTAVYHP